MAVKLGCISNLTQALAYIDEERPAMQTWYPNQVGALDNARALIAQNQQNGGENDSAAISQAQAYILAYQNQARASKGLAPRSEAAALSCNATATQVEEETPAETIGPDSGDGSGGGGGGAGWLWLLAAGGLALLIWKKSKKGKKTRKNPRRSRR